MIPGRISDSLPHALPHRQHRNFSRLLVAAVMVSMVIMIVPIIALSSGSAAASSRPVRTASSPKLLPFGRRSGYQVDTPNWHGKSGFGFALVGSTPAGNGSSAAAIDEATNTIYVANGYNHNGPLALGNTVSVIDGRHCQGTDVSSCKGPWPTLTVGNEPSNITVDQATDTLYVANNTDNTVSVVNGATCNAEVTSGCNQTPATVPVGTAPIGIFADAANHTVYIANFNDNTVSLLNSSTCNSSHLGGCPTTPPPTVSISNNPGDIDVNQTTHTAYVATLAGMSVFDANTCNASTTAGCSTLGTAAVSCVGSTTGNVCGPFTAKVDKANNTVYVSDGDNRVSVFDGRTCNASDLAGCATQVPGTVIVNGGASFEVSVWVAVDVPLHSVYVSNQKDDYLAVIDTNICNGHHLTSCATLKPQTIHTGANPQVIALNQKTQTVYAPNEVDNTVSVINSLLCNASFTAGCRHPAPAVNVGTGVSAIAVDTAVQTAYVANGNTNTVSMINTRKCNASSLKGCDKKLPTAAVGVSPSGIAVDSGTHTVYVTNAGSGATGTVTVIDASKCNAKHSSGCSNVKTLQVPGGNPDGLAINQATDTIYVATITSSGPNIISVFNGATCNATQSHGCTQTPAVILVGNSGGGHSALSLAVNQLTNTIYATNVVTNTVPFGGTSVYVINGATCDAMNTSGCGQVPATIFAGNNPWGIGIDEATDTIYTANIADGEHAGTVSVLNGATCNGTTTAGCGQTPTTVQAGFGAVGVTIDATTHRVYVANIEDTSVSVINGATCNAITTTGCEKTPPKVAVGLTPFASAVDQSVATVYVANGDNTVSVIPAVQ
jgi:DNA-binding beta-propeller fold protein YncE